MGDGVGIGVDREDNAMFSGMAHQFVVEVEPIGAAVDFPCEVLASGVLTVTSGSDIRLYSPAYWQEVTVDTRSADQREKKAQLSGRRS